MGCGRRLHRTVLIKAVLLATVVLLGPPCLAAESVDPPALDVGAGTRIDQQIQRAEQLRSADPKAFRVVVHGLQQQRAQASPKQRAQIDYLEAYGLSFEGQYDAAIALSKRVIETSDDPDTRFLAGLLIANTHTLRRQFVEALRQLDATLALLDQVSTPELRHRGLWVAAFTYSEVGQQELGLRYAERILDDAPEPRTLCFTQQVKFEALYSINKLPRDDEPLQSAIAQCASLHEIAAVNSIRVTLAKKWAGEGKRDAAIRLLEAYLKEVEVSRYAYLISQVKALLADLLLDQGQLGQAEAYASDAIAQSSAENNANSLASAYKTMFRIAEVRNDADQALAYYRRYAEADKAYLNEVKARELAYQMVRQETLEKSQQIQRLDSQNQLLKLQRKLELQSGQNTRLIIILLVLLLASIAYWAYKTKRVQVSLKHLAQTDALTGICNRHHFTELAEHHLAQCAKSGEEAALIMFDLDHFKSINDRFGHPVGDWVLKRVAENCQAFCRRIDVLGRLGGEEFALLMYGCDLRSAARLAEDIRVRLASIDTRDTGHRFGVTASFGVASTATAGYVLERLLSQADDMLYLSKSRGRNRVSSGGEAAREAGDPHETPSGAAPVAVPDGGEPWPPLHSVS